MDDPDDIEIPVERRVLSVIAAVEAFSAGRPITVELSPYVNPYSGAVQGVVLTDLFADVPGNGVGSTVVRELIRLAEEADVSVFTDAEGPRSAAFYVRMGFERSTNPHHQFARHPPLPDYLRTEGVDDDETPRPGMR